MSEAAVFHPSPSAAHPTRPNAVLPFGVRPVQDWLALSGKGLVDVWANPFQKMQQGSLIIETRLPLPKGQVLIHWHNNRGVECGFSLFSTPDGRLSMLYRDGAQIWRLGIALPSFGEASTLRLTLRFQAQSRQWQWVAHPLNGTQPAAKTAGTGAIPIAYQDIAHLCQNARLDPSILWFGFSLQGELPQNLPWIGLRTPLQTVQGTVLAGQLKAGDVILTQDRGPCPVRVVHRVDLPARGSFAPVLLRGPFYHNSCDVLVSANQHIAMSGSAVEYLFGSESVLVAARDVVDGHTAVSEDRRSVVPAVMLDLGGPALICGALDNGGLTLAVGDIRQTHNAPLPVLNPYETVALMRQMGRTVSKVA